MPPAIATAIKQDSADTTMPEKDGSKDVFGLHGIKMSKARSFQPVSYRFAEIRIRVRG